MNPTTEPTITEQLKKPSTSKAFIPKKGYKLNTDDEHYKEILEATQTLLKEKREGYLALLETVHRKKRRDMCIGEYIESVNMVRLIQQKGKLVQMMGTLRKDVTVPPLLYCDAIVTDNTGMPTMTDKLVISQQSQSSRYLHPEEALYLIDNSQLVMYYNPPEQETELMDVIVKNSTGGVDKVMKMRNGKCVTSVQQAFGIMGHNFKNNQFLNIYKLYSHFRRAGYNISRHNKEHFPEKQEDTFAKFMGSFFGNPKKRNAIDPGRVRTGGPKNVGKLKRKREQQEERLAKRVKKYEEGASKDENEEKCRGWYEDDLMPVQDKTLNKVDPDEPVWGSQESYQSEKPLICDLNLKSGMNLKLADLFDTINVIKDVKYTKDIPSIEGHLLFDVWVVGKSGKRRTNESPLLTVCIKEYEENVEINYSECPVMRYWKMLGTDTPLHYAVMGNTSTTLFIQLKPCEVANLTADRASK
ncbi:exportin [Acrasis kona]|uniref:Exportin n=1 Tax=Acrasis kona TaxID=1008807 RepID=A0AAW2YW51_9EUKA